MPCSQPLTLSYQELRMG